MKDLMQKVKSFLTFDFPLDTNNIRAEFAKTHNISQKVIPDWSTSSTRQKVIATYWLKYVLGHFAVVFGLPGIVMFLIFSNFELIYLPVIFVTGLVTYPVLLLFHVWPGFHNNFLPQLETIKESYERKQLEQQEKCRQAQLSNFSITLFLMYYPN